MVNHYERLNVTQDAPPEVIQAAYRALAKRLQPDRLGEHPGLDEAGLAQMAALNAAYEVLIDPQRRQAYDAALAPTSSQRVDIRLDELEREAVQPVWSPSRRTWLWGAGAGVVIVLAMVGVGGQLLGPQQTERALAAVASEAPRPPSVDELSRMSDEELLKVLPTLAPEPSARAARSPQVLSHPHLLDGSPLRLRTEGELIDPLAPDAPPSAARVP